MDRKFFFFDIDNTLLAKTARGNYVPESAKAAIRQLEEQGHFCAIATGRSHAMALPYMKELGFRNMVHDGGNGLTIDGKLIGIEPMDREPCIALIRECMEKDIPWAAQPDDTQKRLAPDDRFDLFTKDRYMNSRIVPGLVPEQIENYFKIYIAALPGEERQLEKLDALTWHREHREYIFVEPMDKAKGIRKVVEHYGGQLKDVVVFGDGGNDIYMFSKEWTCIAMGNAVEEIKQKADYVTAADWDDGIWKACMHFGWVKEQ